MLLQPRSSRSLSLPLTAGGLCPPAGGEDRRLRFVLEMMAARSSCESQIRMMKLLHDKIEVTKIEVTALAPTSDRLQRQLRSNLRRGTIRSGKSSDVISHVMLVFRAFRLRQGVRACMVSTGPILHESRHMCRQHRVAGVHHGSSKFRHRIIIPRRNCKAEEHCSPLSPGGPASACRMAFCRAASGAAS